MQWIIKCFLEHLGSIWELGVELHTAVLRSFSNSVPRDYLRGCSEDQAERTNKPRPSPTSTPSQIMWSIELSLSPCKHFLIHINKENGMKSWSPEWSLNYSGQSQPKGRVYHPGEVKLLSANVFTQQMCVEYPQIPASAPFQGPRKVAWFLF